MSNARRPEGGRGPRAGNSPAGSNEGGYLVEFIQIGNSVKVSAVDPRTNTEVSIIGAPTMSREMLTRNAVRKLEYVLNKKRS